jgi:CheY-like chemotaxis protein
MSDLELRPLYKDYNKRKCFVGHSQKAVWAEDILTACDEAFNLPGFNLEVDYAARHFKPDVSLRVKAVELIANAHYGVYDLSSYKLEDGTWQSPNNVFVELGIAIGLNRPTLLLRHKSNEPLPLPECLKSLDIISFTGGITLRKELIERLPNWLERAPDVAWHNRQCIFGGRICEYREVHPKIRDLKTRKILCHIADGSDVDQDNFRELIENEFAKYEKLEYRFLDALNIREGYSFLICSYCQLIRSSSFAIYRITQKTHAETYVAIGISLALEAQFGYPIPKILITDKKMDVPSILTGYEVVEAHNDRDKKDFFRQFMPEIIRGGARKYWQASPIPFEAVIAHEADTTSTLDKHESHTLDDKKRILIVEDNQDWIQLLLNIFENSEFDFSASTQSAMTFDSAMNLLNEDHFDLILTDINLADNDEFDVSGLKLIQSLREHGATTPIIVLSAYITTEMTRELFRDLKVNDVISKAEFDSNSFVGVINDIFGSPSIRNADYSNQSNPFVIATPVTGNSFLGRQEQLETIHENIKRGTSVVVTGPRASGKTSILQRVGSSLNALVGHRALYLNASGFSTGQQRGKWFFLQLMDAFQRIDKITRVPVIDEDSIGLQDLVSHLENMLENVTKDTKLTIIIDEIEGILSMPDDETEFISKWLRSVANRGDKVTLLVASSVELAELEQSTYTSTLHNMLFRVSLGNFSREETDTLATLGGTIDFSATELDFIYEITSGNPLLTQMLCRLLIETRNNLKKTILSALELEEVREVFREEARRFAQ